MFWSLSLVSNLGPIELPGVRATWVQLRFNFHTSIALFNWQDNDRGFDKSSLTTFGPDGAQIMVSPRTDQPVSRAANRNSPAREFLTFRISDLEILCLNLGTALL